MTCPICNKTTDPAYRPFCSKRCADIDLGNWLTGAYRVPTQEPAGPDADGPDLADRTAKPN